jgi:hypothetical protein
MDVRETIKSLALKLNCPTQVDNILTQITDDQSLLDLLNHFSTSTGKIISVRRGGARRERRRER